ncbi:hypothetical protein MRX96_052113 [Rhipicephalus microplus]
MRFVRVARPRRLCVVVAVLHLLVVLASDRKQQRRLIPVQLPGSPASVKVIMRPKMVDRQLGMWVAWRRDWRASRTAVFFSRLEAALATHQPSAATPSE